MRSLLVIWLFIIGFALTAKAQQPDTVKAASKTDKAVLKEDSITSPPFRAKVKKTKVFYPDSTHSPHKAFIRSAIVPGWGQLYNKRWWKVPIIYTGIGLLGSAIVFNQKYYSQYLAIAKYYNRGYGPAEGEPYKAEYEQYSSRGVRQEAIIAAKDTHRRNRDLSILGTLGAWGINMIDAYVDAKFQHSYTMDDNLSMRITPGLINQPMYAGNFSGGFIPALKVTLTLP